MPHLLRRTAISALETILNCLMGYTSVLSNSIINPIYGCTSQGSGKGATVGLGVFLSITLPNAHRSSKILSLADLAVIFMASLWNRAGRYIFVLWFVFYLSIFYLFSSPNVSRCRMDVYHTMIHMMWS